MPTPTNTRDAQRLAFEAHLSTCAACRIDITLGAAVPALCADGARLVASYVRHAVSHAAIARRAEATAPAAARRTGTTTEALRQLADASAVAGAICTCPSYPHRVECPDPQEHTRAAPGAVALAEVVS